MSPTASNPSQNLRSSNRPLKRLGIEILLTLGVGAGLAYLAMQFIFSELRMMDDRESLRQISAALMHYEQTYGAFPPAYTVDDAGNKLHSWRTLISPYLDDRTSQSIDFNKPWDAPENAAARSANAPGWLRSHGLPATQTCYRVMIDPSGIFTGSTPTKSSSSIDGAGDVLLFVQAGGDQSVHWMAPDDYTLADVLKIAPSNSISGKNYTLAAFHDSSIRELKLPLDPQHIQALVTIDGKEDVASP